MINNQLHQYSTDKYDIFEGMTSISAVIRSITDSTSNRQIIAVYYDKSRAESKSKELKFLSHASNQLSFPVLPCTKEEISEVTNGETHGGLIAVCSKREFPGINVNFLTNGKFFALIEGIEDPYNFGYSLRSLYACGCDGIILPERNWMSAGGVVARSSAGASELFDMYNCEPEEAAKIFKLRGYKIVCADERTDNILGKCELKKPILLIVGGEKRGISRTLIENADILVKIEYGREFRASLSAASATTMFAYEIMRQNSN